MVWFRCVPHGYHMQRIYKESCISLIYMSYNRQLRQCLLSSLFRSCVWQLMLQPLRCRRVSLLMRPLHLDVQEVHSLIASGQASTSTAEPPTLKRRKTLRKGKKGKCGPVYLCGVCQEVCKDEEDITDASDQSVGCDLCYKWFHWGVGWLWWTWPRELVLCAVLLMTCKWSKYVHTIIASIGSVMV